MIYQTAHHQILNYLMMMLLYFQLYTFQLNTSDIELNSDMNKINGWTFQWKMTFNPDRRKQTQEIILSRKLKKATNP